MDLNYQYLRAQSKDIIDLIITQLRHSPLALHLNLLKTTSKPITAITLDKSLEFSCLINTGSQANLILKHDVNQSITPFQPIQIKLALIHEQTKNFTSLITAVVTIYDLDFSVSFLVHNNLPAGTIILDSPFMKKFQCSIRYPKQDQQYISFIHNNQTYTFKSQKNNSLVINEMQTSSASAQTLLPLIKQHAFKNTVLTQAHQTTNYQKFHLYFNMKINHREDPMKLFNHQLTYYTKIINHGILSQYHYIKEELMSSKLKSMEQHKQPVPSNATYSNPWFLKKKSDIQTFK
ncbi:uncharacterized protein KGF55_005811 [Candida pseudojiufengensis]|uniref:uncharacterized protein n=1 Tax=Candida pseudojiufengensis TaxID=497109 RepID=UPI002224D782|nr:uncharacterized protein KGF55_005811 [Candida pseudojiufengensis]KAI5958468.1 hypothetical protein KGF55_005811 [Candida pseudojiufengensis]